MLRLSETVTGEIGPRPVVDGIVIVLMDGSAEEIAMAVSVKALVSEDECRAQARMSSSVPRVSSAVLTIWAEASTLRS